MPSHFQINVVCLTYSLPEYFEKLTLKNKQTRKQLTFNFRFNILYF